MNIYIDEELVKSDILPTNKPTLDETLETFSFALLSSTNCEPYKPMTDVVFEDDDGKKTPFVITTDSIEVVSSNPTRYKHTISCVQNTRRLSKKLIRNSCFSQPPNQTRQSFTAASFVLTGPTDSGGSGKLTDYRATLEYLTGIDTSIMQDGSEPLTLMTNEKALNTYIQVDCKGIMTYQKTNSNDTTWNDCSWRTFTSMSELKTLFNKVGSGYSFVISDNPLKMYQMKNSTKYYYLFSVEDLGLGSWEELEFGKKIKCDKIKSFIDSGYNNLYFYFPSSSTEFVDIKQLRPYVSTSATTVSQYPAYLIFQLRIIAETYTYNGNDILELINTRYMQEYEVEIPSGYTYTTSSTSVYKRNRLYNTYIYDDETRTALNSYYPPSLTFTQNTAFECVNEVFRGLDATFTFEYRESGGLASDDNLKIEYFNNWGGDTISPRFSGVQFVLGEENYNNGLVSYYQDGRVNVKTRSLPIRSRELGVPQENDHGIILPSPINFIKSFTIGTGSTQLGTNFYAGSPSDRVKLVVSSMGKLDLTRYVVDENIWSLLDKSSVNVLSITNPHTLLQVNTCSYAQGDNFINLGRTNANWLGQKSYALPLISVYAFYRELGVWGNTQSVATLFYLDLMASSDKWYNYYFDVEYESTTDGRVVLESLENKYMGESLVEQFNGAIDLNKMGVNMLGLSLKLGQPTLLANHIVSKWSNRIKQGQVYIKDDELWIANVCNYTILPNGMLKGSINFVKNFNALSLHTKLSKARRLSNISNKLTTKSEDNIVDYIYVDTASTKEGVATTPTIIQCDKLQMALLGTFDNSAVSNSHVSPYQAMIKTDQMRNYAYIPLIKYGLGNSICFEMALDHPMKVGNQTTANNSGWFASTTAYFTTAIKYTDNYGYFNTCDIYIGNAGGSQNYPIVSSIELAFLVATASIKNLNYYKQPNEIFALNYQLCFLPNDIQNDFIMPAFINNNYLIDDSNKHVQCSEDDLTYFRFYYDKDSSGIKYSQLDTKAIENDNKDNYIKIIGVSSSIAINSTYCGATTLTFDLQSTLKVASGSWAITDNDGNVYIASNHSRESGTGTISITFYPRSKRKA